MVTVLLRPFILTMKHRAWESLTTSIRGIIALLCSAVILYGIHAITISFLLNLNEHQQLQALFPRPLVHLLFHGLFAVITFSSFISVLGHFYSSNDLPLILCTPVSSLSLFFSRLLQSMASASWMFIGLMIPVGIATIEVYGLSWLNAPFLLFLFLCLALIPTALTSISITIFVNIVPLSRVKETLAVFGMIVFTWVAMFLQLDHKPHSREELESLVVTVISEDSFQPLYLPSSWFAEVVTSLITKTDHSVWLPTALIISTAIGLSALAFLLHDKLFHRAFYLSDSAKAMRKKPSAIKRVRRNSRFSVIPSPVRAIWRKECSMFLRDTTQSVQLILLLFLTFIYLYNFRTLRGVSHLTPEGTGWWVALLGVCNIALGGCVLAAISTRFVYPTISLEGKAFQLIRSAPVSLKGLLLSKCIGWLIPLGSLACLLFVSGAWAVQDSNEMIVTTLIVASAMSVGIIGLAVGVGAVYAQFDWDNPTQVTTNIGSLVYMSLSLVLVLINLIPASCIFVLSSVERFSSGFSDLQYWVLLISSYLLLFFVNINAARRAILAGEHSLLVRD